MTTNNLPQIPMNGTDIGRTAALPFSYTRRLERATSRRMQAQAADAFAEAARIEHDTQNNLARIDGKAAVGAARVHGAVAVQHEETMGLADYGDVVDNRLAQAGPVARQLITESLAQAGRRVNAVTDDAIRNL